eukprot:m.82375 g.82375  ORF g.82375 m.82375 type:complete len:275 (+) comp12688_c0_seq3:839-1663(+)
MCIHMCMCVHFALCTCKQTFAFVDHYLPHKDVLYDTLCSRQDYMTGKDFAGERVLVVGFGNSGVEIALDLVECGAKPDILMRSPVHMVPRWFTYTASLLFPVLLPLKPYLRPLLPYIKPDLIYYLVWGDLTKYNVRLRTSSLMDDIVRYHRAPVQDIGTMALIREGKVKVIPEEISHIDGFEVTFKDKSHEKYDSIILATGFNKGAGPYNDFLDADIVSGLVNEYGVVESGYESRAHRQLYFLGFSDFLGRLGEMGVEAQRVANDMQRKGYAKQ